MLLDEFIMCMALCNTVVVSDLNTATFALKGAATEAVSAPLRYCRSTAPIGPWILYYAIPACAIRRYPFYSADWAVPCVKSALLSCPVRIGRLASDGWMDASVYTHTTDRTGPSTLRYAKRFLCQTLNGSLNSLTRFAFAAPWSSL